MPSIELRNDQISVALNARDGSILQITDAARGQSYLADPLEHVPFRLFKTTDTVAVQGFKDFRYTLEEDRVQLTWDLEDASLQAEVTLLTDGVSFSAKLEPNSCDTPAYAVEYPLIQGISGGRDTFLAHAYATGILLEDPTSILPTEGALRFVPYPESFSGASMQLMTFYRQDQGGLYLASHDGAGHQKWLNAYTEIDQKDRLTLSHMFGLEDLRPGKGAAMNYPFVIRLTAGQGWEEAAAMYREFALKQHWCAQGPLTEQAPEERAAWLQEEVGYATFGINAGHDRSHWLKRYRQDIGTPGLQVLGPDWTNKPQTFGRGIPGGLADWLPTRFSEETLEAIRTNGDRFAPFEFDFLVATHQTQQDELKHNLQRFPSPTFSHDHYNHPMLCPGQSFTKDFHRTRDLQVREEAEVDAMYYDISANNLIKLCMREDHEHTPGGGKELDDGYREIFEDTGQALSEAAGEKIPLGTEMMNETMLGVLDYYQARSWGQPASALEMWPFIPELRTGQVRPIPMFTMVYHEYGAVRMDGWGKLVDEIGELYYDTVAKTYLWGALYEINHEYSPMEMLDGQENTEEEHYAAFEPRGYEYSPERAAYIREFALARIGVAKQYWGYGRMLPAPSIEVPTEMRSWFHYNHGVKTPTYEKEGEHPVPAVRTSAYESPDGKIGVFFANSSEQEQAVSLPLEELAEAYGERRMRLSPVIGGAASDPVWDSKKSAGGGAVTLEPRTLYLLELS